MLRIRIEANTDSNVDNLMLSKLGILSVKLNLVVPVSTLLRFWFLKRHYLSKLKVLLLPVSECLFEIFVLYAF